MAKTNVDRCMERIALLDETARVLADVFGREWLRLSDADQDLIVRDCTEDGGVSDFALYRRNIGTGNLESYAKCMRVRFSRT